MNRIARRHLLIAAGALLAAPSIVRAQAWPAGQVRIVVAFPPGGAADIVARLAALRLAEMWNAAVLVDNKPGAGGNIAGAEVARTPPDGANFLITSSSAAVNKLLYKTMPYDPFTDLSPVTTAISVPNVMVVPAASPDKTIADFIARAKATPGKLNFGSAGIGTSIHLAGELFKHLAKVDIAHVPYRGAAPAMNDLIAGRLDVIFDTLTLSATHLRADTIRALGVTSKDAVASLPGVPPIASVVPGFAVTSWFAFFAAARTPDAILAKAARDIEAALRHPPVAEKLADLGAVVVGGAPATLAEAMTAEEKLWAPVIAAAGIGNSQ